MQECIFLHFQQLPLLAYERSSNVHLKYQKHFQCTAWLLNVGSSKYTFPPLHFFEGKGALDISSKEKFHLQVKGKVKFVPDVQVICNLQSTVN